MAVARTTTEWCHMATSQPLTSRRPCKKAALCLVCPSQSLLLLLVCLGTLCIPSVQAFTMSTTARIRPERSALTPPTVTSLRPPNKTQRGASAAGVRGAPTGAQPPLVMSLQAPSATSSFRRGGLRRHDAPDKFNRPPTVPIATTSTRTHYRGAGLRSQSPSHDRPFFNAPSVYPDSTRHYSERRTSANLPPTIISYGGNSRQSNYPQQESQIQEMSKTDKHVIDEDSNVIGIKMTSPEGKTTIEFMRPPVFDSSGNPIILDLATAEDKFRPFDMNNETDYEYESSREGGIWDEEEKESGIWGPEENQSWGENDGGRSSSNRGGWGMGNDNNNWGTGNGRSNGQVLPKDIGSTHRSDTFGHIIEEDLSHLRNGYSPRRNYQHRTFNTPQVYPVHERDDPHRQVISPKIQTHENLNNRNTLSITEIMRATNKTSDDLVEILKLKGIVFKDFLQLIKDGATLQHVTALLSTPNVTTSTSRPDIVSEIFSTISPSVVGNISTKINETSFGDIRDQHFEYDAPETEDLDGTESEEILIVENSENTHSGRSKGRNGSNSDKRHNRHGKSKRKNANKHKKRDKKKSKDLASEVFLDPIYSTDIFPVNISTNENQEDDLGIPFIPQPTASSTTTTKAILMVPTLPSTASSVIETSTGLPEIITNLNTSSTVPPEILPVGPRADSLTLPPTNKISEATIIAISIEEALRIKSPNEETVSEFDDVKSSEVRKPIKGIYKQKEEDFKWDKTLLEEDYVQDIYTKPLDHSWQLTQVDEHVVTSKNILEEPISEYKIPLKGLLIISGILGALAVFTFVILISYTVIKCTKPPIVNNYQVNEQKSVT